MSARELDRRLRRLEASAPRLRHQPAELGAEAMEAMEARVARMLAPLPDPDTPDWTPVHHAVLVEAAALKRSRWVLGAGAEPGHDLLADLKAVVEVARILREAGVPPPRPLRRQGGRQHCHPTAGGAPGSRSRS